MDGTTITGYHTTHIDNLKSILENGFLMSKPNANHWLGKGVYFFKDIYYAEEWKIIGVAKRYRLDEKNGIDNSCIVVAEINCEEFEMVDFSTPTGYEIFKTFLDVLKEEFTEEEYKEILRKGNHYIIKMLEKLETVKDKKILSLFDIVCADFHKNMGIAKNDLKQKSNFLSVVQKQICVKNIKAIKGIYKLNETNEHKRMLEIVRANRRDKNDK